VVAVESDLRGGTMSTVGHAITQKRLVYCPELKKIRGYPPDAPSRKASISC